MGRKVLVPPTALPGSCPLLAAMWAQLTAFGFKREAENWNFDVKSPDF